jgi:hypothetical protein
MHSIYGGLPRVVGPLIDPNSEDILRVLAYKPPDGAKRPRSLNEMSKHLEIGDSWAHA